MAANEVFRVNSKCVPGWASSSAILITTGAASPMSAVSVSPICPSARVSSLGPSRRKRPCSRAISVNGFAQITIRHIESGDLQFFAAPGPAAESPPCTGNPVMGIMPSRQRFSDNGEIIRRIFHHQVQVFDHFAEHRTGAEDFHLTLRPWDYRLQSSALFASLRSGAASSALFLSIRNSASAL